jgi:hypothetical protein
LHCGSAERVEKEAAKRSKREAKERSNGEGSAVISDSEDLERRAMSKVGEVRPRKAKEEATVPERRVQRRGKKKDQRLKCTTGEKSERRAQRGKGRSPAGDDSFLPSSL